MPYAWNWTGRDRVTGKVCSHYTTGPYEDAASLCDHLDAHYRGLTDFQVQPADGPPKAVLRPVDPRHFQGDVLDLVRRELGGRRAARAFGDMGRRVGLARTAPAGVIPAGLARTPSRPSAAPSRLR